MACLLLQILSYHFLTHFSPYQMLLDHFQWPDAFLPLFLCFCYSRTLCTSLIKSLLVEILLIFCGMAYLHWGLNSYSSSLRRVQIPPFSYEISSGSLNQMRSLGILYFFVLYQLVLPKGTEA